MNFENRREFLSAALFITAGALGPLPAFARAKTPTIAAGGGGRYPRDMWSQAAKKAGGRGAKALISPYAHKDPKREIGVAEGLFRSAGIRNVEILDISSSKNAVEQVRGADIIWFIGGYQKHQVLTLANVPGLTKELRNAHSRGTVMAGGSAGAAVMSRLMISGDGGGTAYTRAGLGFLDDVVLDQHITRRKREWRLRQVVSNNRSKLGLGMSEGTGVLIEGSRFKVYGSGQVRVVYWRNGKLVETELRRGSKYDLESRRKL